MYRKYLIVDRIHISLLCYHSVTIDLFVNCDPHRTTIICSHETYHWPLIWLFRARISCNSVEKSNFLVAPSFENERMTCHLQQQPLLYSCVASSVSHMRICPCRDYIKGQVALCKDCWWMEIANTDIFGLNYLNICMCIEDWRIRNWRVKPFLIYTFSLSVREAQCMHSVISDFPIIGKRVILKTSL